MNAEQWGRGDSTRIATRDFPAAVVALVEERAGRGCWWCKRAELETPDDEPLELDHLQPLSQGGDNHHTNLVWSCRGHNRSKRNRVKPHARPPWARGVKGHRGSHR